MLLVGSDRGMMNGGSSSAKGVVSVAYEVLEVYILHNRLLHHHISYSQVQHISLAREARCLDNSATTLKKVREHYATAS